MDKSDANHPDSKPWKILLSLLDKWEISASLIEEFLHHALQVAQRHDVAKEKQETSEACGKHMLLCAAHMQGSSHSLSVIFLTQFSHWRFGGKFSKHSTKTSRLHYKARL